MIASLHILAWLLVGLAMASVHLALLHRAVQRSLTLVAHEASRSIAQGLPLRLLMWVPALILAARTGLGACVGLVLGSLIGRWLIYLRTRDNRRFLMRPDNRG